MENNLTDFSKNCIEECKHFIKDALGVEVEFSKEIGKTEAYYKATIDVSNHTVEIYVYDDEAGFMVDKKEWTIFEIQDFSSDAALVESFTSELKKYINANK